MNRITRYICSSVYDNYSLREKIIDIIEDDYRIIADSYGIEIGEVIKHCYNAKRRDNRYYYLIFIILLLMLIGILFSLEVLIPLGLLLILFFSIVHSYQFEKNILRKYFLNNSHSSHISTPSSSKIATLINKKNNQISQNLVYYSFFSPFVGAGIELEGWSFAIDIDKGKEGSMMPPETFHEHELYTAVANEIKSLKFQNLQILDKLYINGSSIRNNRKLLPNIMGHPLNKITSSEINVFKGIYNKNARYYQLFQISDWEDELVLNIFLRFFKNEKNLFIELNYYLLTPTEKSYTKVDRISEKLFSRDYFKILFKSLFKVFVDSIRSILLIFNKIDELQYRVFHSGRDKKAYELRKQVKTNPEFNYGAEMSIRELISSKLYYQLFQKLDKEMYHKIIEKRILNTINDFLEKKNIELKEFKERQTNILNHGVIVTGGNLNTQNLAIGKKAKNITSTFQFKKLKTQTNN
ncbi:hypothetical protein OKW21_005816 [Catalinimonas alkaloidigena]|uniref:hypothetical protein n=1 Tax=Catalinimonas alkaloidigena TaxID=1075417 RepID=UPI002405D406|nr:hypothetical protein [Catalinimonas alkaloidigena]MDF9800553.1 hypothetical protein [Catalinimonas alkaloidigena]